LAVSGELQNRFGGNLHCVITPELSVLFVTVHTNAIVVTTRISVADLIGGGGNTDICPRTFACLAPPLLGGVNSALRTRIHDGGGGRLRRWSLLRNRFRAANEIVPRVTTRNKSDRDGKGLAKLLYA